MAIDLERSNPEDDFDWAGESGDKMAEWNPASAEEKDKQWTEFYGKPFSDVVSRALEVMKKNGLQPSDTKVLDIGCSTGGILAVLENLGFRPANLQGIDISPKAIQIGKNSHPQYKVEVVNGFDYGKWNVDFLLHVGLLCQMPPEDYDKLFAKIREINPWFYMIVEGINPDGYAKIPNRVAHEYHSNPDDHTFGHTPLDEGYHHTNDMEKVVEEKLPEATKIFSEPLNFTDKSRDWFQSLHVQMCKCNVYLLR